MPKLYLAALLASFSLGLSAHADKIFTLSNVTLSSTPGGAANSGTLAGTFTTNDALSSILTYNITASAAGSFAGFQYTTSNSSVTAAVLPSQFFQIDSTGNVNELRLYFANGLTSAGGTINPTFSYESEPSGGNRFPSGMVTVATTTVTPEPSSIVLLGTGLLGMAGVARRRFT